VSAGERKRSFEEGRCGTCPKKLDRKPKPMGKFFRHVHKIEQRLITEEILIEVAIEEEIEAKIAAHAEKEEDIRVHAEDVEDESDEGSLSWPSRVLRFGEIIFS